jgi:hypothetical protein
MKMPLARAQDVLKAYRENNYNASKALQGIGYKETTATRKSKDVINGAIRTVAKAKLEKLVTNKDMDLSKLSLIESIGLTDEEVTGEYLKIIAQDKDLSTKLKALLPLLAIKGIKWDENQTKVTVPILNITTETILPEQLGPKDTIDVAQSILCDIDRG